MEKFSIQLVEQTFLIEPQENGTFRIFDGEEKIGVIYPEVEEDGTVWKTMDNLDNDFVQQLGELVSEHNM
ncbi:MAG: hypothetical protein EOO47_07065 [Flavobacterium sp.]|nr:MAG: hypothetical protein EOO47_07065 [Flavobacterium sp.]